MIILLSTLIFALFLNECNAVKGCFSAPSTSSNFKIDNFQYQGDPIRFACITLDSQFEFYLTEVNGSIPSALVKRLDNGNGLSLLFHGVANTVDSSFGLLFYFAKEWFKESGNNICIVSYAYTTTSSNVLKMYPIVNKMVKTQRVEYVAKMARDLVFGVREKCLKTTGRKCLRNLSQVDVTGFSFGAHVAGQTCKYMFQKMGEKVRMLLALDPIKFPVFGAKIKDSIKRGDAGYVQVIHTSKKVGIWDQIGDFDVYINFEGVKNLGPLNDEHGLAFFIHIAVATKRIFISQSGYVFTNDGESTNVFNLDCGIGIYSTSTSNQFKKINVTFNKRNAESFWEGISGFTTAELFLGSQQVEKEENISNDPDNNECVLCYENTKNAILYPCKHKETCVSCWVKWKNQQSTLGKKCPICKREVFEFKEIKN